MSGMVCAVTGVGGMAILPGGCMARHVMSVGGNLGSMSLVCGLSTHIMHGVILVRTVFGMFLPFVLRVIHSMVLIPISLFVLT